MASVSKLVLVLINMWHRLSKDRKDIDIHSIQMVDIPSASQSSSGGGSINAPLPDPLALPEGPVVGASSLSPPSLPLPSPPGEGGGGGEGKEEEHMYIDREVMGKEKTPSEIERVASMWRPLGKVIIKCKWIHI